ncbi:MAG: nitroreductase family deazaflavin-dependent oxidoreductase [Streptosporangiaceae bacterium]
MFGYRFLLLTHRGRRTGLVHRTMLEVLRWDPRTHEAVAIAGFGPGSDWFRNVTEGHALEVQVGRERFVPTHRVLDTAEASDVFLDYEHRNRMATTVLRRVVSGSRASRTTDPLTLDDGSSRRCRSSRSDRTVAMTVRWPRGHG